MSTAERNRQPRFLDPCQELVRRPPKSRAATAVAGTPPTTLDTQADIQQSLTTLREKLLKIGATVVGHGRYVTFQLADVAVPRELFQKILPD